MRKIKENVKINLIMIHFGTLKLNKYLWKFDEINLVILYYIIKINF